jgi:hypothetical protein
MKKDPQQGILSGARRTGRSLGGGVSHALRGETHRRRKREGLEGQHPGREIPGGLE